MAVCGPHGPGVAAPFGSLLQWEELWSQVPLGLEPAPAVAPFRSQYTPMLVLMPVSSAMKWLQSQKMPGSVWVLQVVAICGQLAAIQVFQAAFCHSPWPMMWLRSLGMP